VKGYKNFSPKQVVVAILIIEQVDIRLKSVRKDNEGHFILIKGTIHQDEITVLNIYAQLIGTLK
jgi:hypothetical protein